MAQLPFVSMIAFTNFVRLFLYVQDTLRYNAYFPKINIGSLL